MTKERLRRYLELKREKEQIENLLEGIEAMLYFPKVQRYKDTTSGPVQGNPMEDMAGRHMELLNRYRGKLGELDEELLTIERAIEGLDCTARTLLRFRYIDGLAWEEVCVKMSYSWAQTHRLHAQALERLRTMEQ